MQIECAWAVKRHDFDNMENRHENALVSKITSVWTEEHEAAEEMRRNFAAVKNDDFYTGWDGKEYPQFTYEKIA